MAITTFSELQTAIIERSQRADTTAIAAECIALFEADFNNNPRMRCVEQEDSTAFTASNRLEDLPDDLLEIRMVESTVSPGKELSYLSPERASQMLRTSPAGDPRFYTIRGKQIEVIPAGAVRVYYWKKLPALSVSNTSNWLLEQHPGVYLYGSLIHLAIWAKNDEERARFESAMAQRAQALSVSDRARRYGGGLVARLT